MLYADWAKRRGMFGGNGYYRIVQPARYMMEDIEIDLYGKIIETAELSMDKSMSSLYEKLKNYDVFYSFYTDNKEVLEIILKAQKDFGLKVIFDADDDVFNIDPKSPYYKDFEEGTERRELIKKVLSSADALTVSTEYLKEQYSKYNKNVHVCANAADADDWNNLPKSQRDGNGIVIGWAGSFTHESDLETIIPALKTILDKYPNVGLAATGYKPACFDELHDMYGDRIMVFEGTLYWAGYPELLSKLGYDIGIAPLLENEFNKSKSNIKWMEYAMVGTPTIASTFPNCPYNCITDNVDGLLASTTEEWIEKLELLINDSAKRKALAFNARKTIRDKYNIKKNYISRINVINEVYNNNTNTIKG